MFVKKGDVTKKSSPSRAAADVRHGIRAISTPLPKTALRSSKGSTCKRRKPLTRSEKWYNIIGSFANLICKLARYVLDQQKASDKARVFELVLGYTKANASELLQSIFDHADESRFVEKGNNGYGIIYGYVMRLAGPHDKQANVLTAWIDDHGRKRLISVYVMEKR